MKRTDSELRQSHIEDEEESLIKSTDMNRQGPELWKILKKKVLDYIRMSKELIHTDTYKFTTEIPFSSAEHKRLGTIFHPESGFIWNWNIFLSVMLLYSSLVSPVSLAFGYVLIYPVFAYFDLLIDFFFILDILIKSNTATYDEEKILVIDRKTILKKYLKSKFAFDLISAFPYEFIALKHNLLNPDYHFFNITLRLLYLKQLSLVFRIFRFIEFLSETKTLFFLRPLILRFSLGFNSRKLLSVILRILLLVHIFACYWCYLEIFEEGVPDSWMIRYNFHDLSNSEKYLRALYFIITTLSTVGYGDITPKTTFEIVLTITWMTAAVYFLSFNISNISSMISESNLTKNLLETKMALVENYCKKEGVSLYIKGKIKFEVKEQVAKVIVDFLEKEEIISYLSIDLKYEIAQSMHANVLKEFSLFIGRDKDFLGNIFTMLSSRIMNRNEIVFLQDQTATNIYFIAKGVVELTYKNISLNFRRMGTGQYFGDYEVIFNRNRCFGAIVNNFAHLLIMNDRNYKRFQKDFFLIWTEFKNIAIQRQYYNIKALAELMGIRMITFDKKIASIDKNELKKLINYQYEILIQKNIVVSLDEIRNHRFSELKHTLAIQKDRINKLTCYV